MKTAFLTVIILVTATVGALGQAFFTLAEMEKMCQLSQSEFEFVVLQRNYSLSVEQSSALRRVYYIDEQPNAATKQVVREQTNAKWAVLLTFCTPNKEAYLNFFSDLKNAGYTEADITPIKKGNGLELPRYLYSNGQYTAVIIIDSFKFQDLPGVTTYTIQFFPGTLPK